MAVHPISAPHSAIPTLPIKCLVLCMRFYFSVLPWPTSRFRKFSQTSRGASHPSCRVHSGLRRGFSGCHDLISVASSVAGNSGSPSSGGLMESHGNRALPMAKQTTHQQRHAAATVELPTRYRPDRCNGDVRCCNRLGSRDNNSSHLAPLLLLPHNPAAAVRASSTASPSTKSSTRTTRR